MSCTSRLRMILIIHWKDRTCSHTNLNLLRVKVDSHMLRHDAARYDAVRHNATETHGFCSHTQRVLL